MGEEHIHIQSWRSGEPAGGCSCLLKLGDKVNKASGYRFPGTIVAVFENLKGETRYVVEMDGYGLLHIFNGGQLVTTNEEQTV